MNWVPTFPWSASATLSIILNQWFYLNCLIGHFHFQSKPAPGSDFWSSFCSKLTGFYSVLLHLLQVFPNFLPDSPLLRQSRQTLMFVWLIADFFRQDFIVYLLLLTTCWFQQAFNLKWFILFEILLIVFLNFSAL